MSYLTQCYQGRDNRRREGWWLHFRYDEFAVQRLKARVQPQYRSWDSVGRRWWVSNKSADIVSRIFPNFDAFQEQSVEVDQPSPQIEMVFDAND